MIRPDADTRRIKKHFYNKHMCLFLRLNVGLMFTFLGQKHKKNPTLLIVWVKDFYSSRVNDTEGKMYS